MTSRFSVAMREAIDLASQHNPHPNPRVGCVVVGPTGDVVARGAHRARGEPHAERLALERLEHSDPSELTMVVTLEPCAHQGLTPPCTAAIIDSGIPRVVVGSLDPDIRVSGRGVAALRSAGIDVVEGVETASVERLDPGYFHHRRTGLPRVVLKTASTLDGQIAAADGSSRWITAEVAREDAHRLRSRVDAIIVGAGTVIADDPELTVRLPGFTGRQPRPVIVAGRRPLPVAARLFERGPLILTGGPIRVPAGEVVECGTRGEVDLEQGLTALADRGLIDVLVEGGAGLAASLWHGNLVTEGVTYIGGRIAGGIGRGIFDRAFHTITESRRIDIRAVDRLGPDLRVSWVPEPT